jgi:class 3 adenylate cyclase/pimeloyl-ACP methyl ester carboxylesterase
MPPVTRYARNGDVHIAYQTFGEGPVDLLYVPQSFSVVEHLWEHPAVSRFFARISSFARVIAFDRRESGMSDRLGRPPTLEEQMDDVVAVLDAAEADRVGIFAMLEGGPMAMMFAATHPERTGALMLYATFARTTWAPGYEWAPTEAQRAVGQGYLLDHWGDGSIIEVFAPSHREDRRMRDWLGSLQRYAMGPTGAKALNDINMGLDVRPILPSIRVPTLVMHREGDVGINPKHSQFLAANIPGAKLRMLPGVDNFPFVGDVDSVLGEMEEFLTGARGTQDRDRVLATVLLSDICKSTERAAELGDRVWRDLLREHHEDAARTVKDFSGRLIKSTGDGILATFDGPARAIRAGDMLVQDASRLGVDLRVGLHTGELELLDDDVSGLAVHIAARVMDRAGPGEVIVSSTVRDLVVGSRLDFEDRGTHELRGVPGDWRLWSLTA